MSDMVAELIEEAALESTAAKFAADVPAVAAAGGELSRQTRQEHDALLRVMHRLEAALASPATGREHHWNRRVLARLRELRHALSRHTASAEAADGLLANIDPTRPTLARHVEQLRRQHPLLLTETCALLGRVRDATIRECYNCHEVRRQAATLLGAIRHHQALEADLIFESFYTDIGTGD
jgi:hypothetical protein